MPRLQDIRSLTEFSRNTKAYAKNLKKTGAPTVLTVNGRAAFVVQDAVAYQRLLDRAAQAEDHRKLAQSLHELESGRIHDFDSTARMLKKKYLAKRR